MNLKLCVTQLQGNEKKKEVGLVIPGKFKCTAKKQKFGKILHQELLKKKNKYNYFELDVMDFEDKKVEYL